LWFAGGRFSDWFAYTRHSGLNKPVAAIPPTADVGYMPTCCALVSSAAWREIGPVRADYFMYYEDTEWCQRAREAGWRCRYLGEVLCSHAVSASSGRRGSLGLSENMAYYLARNPMRFALETKRPILRYSRIAGLLTVWTGFNVSRMIQARNSALARAYLEGLVDAFRGQMGKRPDSSRRLAFTATPAKTVRGRRG
jgi:GT2 family glycosyltransferase